MTTPQSHEDGATQSDRVRVAFSMLRADYDELKRLADADGRTLTYYIREALSTHRWVKQQQDAGRSIWVSGEAGQSMKWCSDDRSQA